MKLIYSILALSIVLIFACNKMDDHYDDMPESDKKALEDMSAAYQSALLFNDSLTICTNEPSSCDSATMFHYDEMFHQFIDQFDFHHGEYSHKNVDDDHHHNTGQSKGHGNMMGHIEHGNHNSDYEHNNETLEEMMHLRELHVGVHPQ